MRLTHRFLLLFISPIALIGNSKAIEPCKVSDQAKELVKVLGKNHYSPAANTPENNRRLLALFFAKLDPLKVMFTEGDLTAFQQKNYRLNDSLQNDACKLAMDCLPFIVGKFNAFRNELTGSKKEPMSFSKKDSLFPYKIAFQSFAKTESERKGRMKKYNAWWFLNRAYSEWDQTGSFSAYCKANEKRILLDEIKQKECELFQNKRYEPEALTLKISKSILESLAELYDPHTNYFSGSDLSEFNTQLSAEAGSFGVVFGKNELNRIEVNEVMRGSSTWKNSEIEEGDQILEIELDGKKLDDMYCQDMEDLNAGIEAESGRTLSLKVKKADGKTQQVTLHKSALEVSENHLDGCHLIHQNQKTGYLPLPSFFYAGESTSGGSATVIGQELVNLQKEGINGLILDLRGNGGGSVKEALELIGLFIDVGPVGIFNSRNTKPEIIKETIRGTLYNGPLIVLVNGQSASASEITAAALQDLGKAIVVGSPTFGKASVQVVFPIGPKSKEQNHVKTTIGMIYRTSGFSHQQTGVKPDILLENRFENILPGESDLPGSLFALPIQKRVEFPRSTILHLDSISARSAGRWNKEKHRGTNPFVILEPAGFALQMREEEADTSHTQINEKLFDIQYTGMTMARVKLDPGLRSSTERQKNSIRQDPQIGEAFRILSDFHSFKKQ